MVTSGISRIGVCVQTAGRGGCVEKMTGVKLNSYNTIHPTRTYHVVVWLWIVKHINDLQRRYDYCTGCRKSDISDEKVTHATA